MLLRDHPLLNHRGIPSWPPTWTWIGGLEDKCPQGEVGILKAVELSHVLPADGCFLIIDYEESLYMGCLLIDDEISCGQMMESLQGSSTVLFGRSVAWTSLILCRTLNSLKTSTAHPTQSVLDTVAFHCRRKSKRPRNGWAFLSMFGSGPL
jgi:hypothetical protein